MEAVEVCSGTWAVLTRNQTSNAGFVLTRRGPVVIDTFGSPAQGHELAAVVSRQSGRGAWLVVNTHHHFDHVLGNQAFDAPVVAHCAFAEQLAQAVARDLGPDELASWVNEHPEDRWLCDELEVIYPSLVFSHDLLIDLPPKRLVLKHVGGHTPESIVVDLPDEGVLFAADLVFEGRVPYLRSAHFSQTIAALQQLERLGPRVVIPGHGALCNAEYVRRCREYLETLVESVRRLIRAGWDRESILSSGRLPVWWTEDRPELLRANLERLYAELAGPSGSSLPDKP